MAAEHVALQRRGGGQGGARPDGAVGPARSQLGVAAFTVIELLVVIAIIAVLAGIVYTFVGPARAKSRQAVCASNLRQIGVALQLYRSDCGGEDAASTPEEYGIPPTGQWGLLPYLSNNQDVLHCPAARPDLVNAMKRASRDGRWSLYGFNTWWPPLPPGCPAWGDAVSQRGPEFPIVYCDQHDNPPPDRPVSTKLVIVLRLAGGVTSRWVPVEASWKW